MRDKYKNVVYNIIKIKFKIILTNLYKLLIEILINLNNTYTKYDLVNKIEVKL